MSVCSKSVYSVYPRSVCSDDFHIFQEFEGPYDGWLVMGAVVLNSITRLVNSKEYFKSFDGVASSLSKHLFSMPH